MPINFSWTSQLTGFDLLTRGYFHDRVIPALSSTELAPAVSEIQSYIAPIIQNAIANRFKLQLSRTRPGLHSVPKRKHLRRVLTIPHPLAYAVMSEVLAGSWAQIQAVCASPISMSMPMVSSTRAVETVYKRNDEPELRARASVGMRYLLKTDLVRYYPSVYTHSIPWAIHGKAAARNDPHNYLYGNRLDACVRELQDRQTGGIPIGPDASYIIGEVLGATMDRELVDKLGAIPLRGTRFIDDYHLYFSTRSDAEKGLAALHQVARMFELEINDTKTEVCELPEVLEPKWKGELRSILIEPSDSGRSIYMLFDRAAEFASAYPFDSVFTYVAKKLLDAALSIESWATAEPLLLRAAIAEPSMLTVLDELFKLHGVLNKPGLQLTLESICNYHAPLQQGYEVAWALWVASTTGTPLSSNLGSLIIEVDDDIVALVALDLRAKGLLSFSTCPLWQSRMDPASLNSEHWLLAYEALRHGWLTSTTGVDYVANEAFFSILQNHDVHFYDPTGVAGTGASLYGTS